MEAVKRSDFDLMLGKYPIPGISPYLVLNKPENQDEDALGKIEQQQDFVILNLTLRVLDND